MPPCSGPATKGSPHAQGVQHTPRTAATQQPSNPPRAPAADLRLAALPVHLARLEAGEVAQQVVQLPVLDVAGEACGEAGGGRGGAAARGEPGNTSNASSSPVASADAPGTAVRVGGGGGGGGSGRRRLRQLAVNAPPVAAPATRLGLAAAAAPTSEGNATVAGDQLVAAGCEVPCGLPPPAPGTPRGTPEGFITDRPIG
jgi:hypothetical protein